MARMSMFTASPFRPKGYNQSVMRPHTLGERLGDWRDVIGGIIGELIDPEDFGLDDLEKLLGDFDDLLAEIPVGALKDSFEKRRDECLEKDNPYNRYTCLYQLAQDIKAHLEDEDKKPPATKDDTGRQPEENGFPWVPVGIAAGIGTAALLYLIFRPKTPAANNKKKK